MLKKLQAIAMVEIMITMAITVLGLLGLGALQLKASQTVQDTGNRAQAIWIAEDLTNRIRANIVALDDYDTNDTRDSLGTRYTCPAAVTRCADFHDGSSRTAATTCTSQQMAEFDLWETACGNGANVASSAITRSTSTDYIANPQIIVDVKGDDRVEIQLSWDVRTSGQDASGNAVYTQDNADVRRSTYTTEFKP
jgi:type IV pilus assembly protein PilV